MKIYGLNDFYKKFYKETEGDEKTKGDIATARALKVYREQAEKLETFTFQIKLAGEPHIDTSPSSGKTKKYFYSAFGYDDEGNDFLIIFHTLFDGYSKDIDWEDAHVSTYPNLIEIPKFIIIK